MEKVFGTIASLSSIILIIFGLTSQIIKNYQRHSVEGLSPGLFILTVVAYLCWMTYGIIKKPKKDLFLIIPNAIGILIGGVIIVQFFLYH